MEKYLNILEATQPQQDKTFDEEKVRFINSEISIWDYFGVPRATCFGYTNEEKSRMFKEYYNKLVNKCYDPGKIFCLFHLVCLVSFSGVSIDI